MRWGALVFGVLLLPGSARALPPPKSDAEMMALSDLVVDAACVTIVCEGTPYDDGQKIITTYRSTLFPSKSYKGGMPNSFVIIGQSYVYHGTPPVGVWHQEPVAKGWAGKLYLKKETAGTYTKVWWNAMEEDTTLSKPQPLPLCASGDGGPPDGPAPDIGSNPDLHPWPIKDDPMILNESSMAREGDSHRYMDGSSAAEEDGCSCRIGRPARETGLPCLLLLWLLVWGIRERAAR